MIDKLIVNTLNIQFGNRFMGEVKRRAATLVLVASAIIITLQDNNFSLCFLFNKIES